MDVTALYSYLIVSYLYHILPRANSLYQVVPELRKWDLEPERACSIPPKSGTAHKCRN